MKVPLHDNNRGSRLWPVLLLFAIALAITLGKLPGMPTKFRGDPRSIQTAEERGRTSG